MALAENREVDHYVDQELRSYQVAAGKHVYRGALVGLASSGYAEPLVAGRPCVGIAYEEADNANGQIEPNEGVRGLSLRVVDARTNDLLASAFTDPSGFTQIQALADGDVIVIIPLLGETLRVRRSSPTTTWTLRIDPANVPGLIP